MSEGQRSIVLASMSDAELEGEILSLKLKGRRALHDGRSGDAEAWFLLCAEAVAERSLRAEEALLP